MPETRAALPRGCAEVVSGSWCIGCGVCASACPHDRIGMTLTGQGAYEPRVDGECPGACTACARVCPFALVPWTDEDAIGEAAYASGGSRLDGPGWYRQVLVGGARDATLRRGSASGGIGAWLAGELLRRGDVDAVVTVGPRDPDTEEGVTAGYRVCRTPADVSTSAGSHYCPAHIDGALAAALAGDGRVAVVGLPCVIKAVRLLQAARPGVASGVVAMIGLTCGQNKTWGFTRAAVEGLGVAWSDVTAVRYRRKREEAPASAWLLEVERADGTSVNGPFPVDVWVDRAFTFGACEACDDALAECADVTLMDAWAQPYVSDPRGTSAVVVRTAAFEELLAEGVVRGELELAAVDPGMVRRMQSGVLTQKREALAYRVALWESQGTTVPRKRVSADRGAGGVLRRAIWRLEISIAEATRLEEWADAAGALARVARTRRRLRVLRRLRNLEVRARGER